MADSVSGKTPPPPIIITRPSGPGRLLSKEAFIRTMMEVMRKLGIRMTFDGADEVRETKDGLQVKITSGAAAVITHPWQFSRLNPGGTFGISGGSYGIEHVDGIADLGTGSGYVYLVASWDLDVVTGEVLSASLNSVSMASGSSIPSSNPYSGLFYIPLGAFNAGVVVAQDRTASIDPLVCDDGSGAGRAEHHG